MRAARARDALLVLIRAVECALVQPVGEPAIGAEFSDEVRDLIAPVPIAPRALDAQHGELSDQVADCSIGGHFRGLAPAPIGAKTH